MKKALLISALLATVLSVAQAQAAGGVIEITPQITSADGQVTPVVTWKTTPEARSCTASGDWTGTKAGHGTETLPTTMKSVTFNLSCVWDDSTAIVHWTPPTQNTDGSAYTDGKGYRVAYGTAPDQLTTVVDIDGVDTTTYEVKQLAPGTWYFGAVAVNARGVASEMSNPVSKTLGTVTGEGSVGITVNPVPQKMLVTVE